MATTGPLVTRYLPMLAGVTTAAALLAALLLAAPDWRENLRETGFDLVLAMDQHVQPLTGVRGPGAVVVIDIDDRSIETLGPWPWPRELIAKLIDAIAKAGAGFRSLADAWADTTTAHGRLMLTVLGGLAEFERDLIRARTGEGRKRARSLGVHMGRPPKLTKH